VLDKKISVEIGSMNKLRKKTDDTGSDIKHFTFTSQVMKLITS